MTRTTPQIAIIGAGPAGLTLGVLLHKQGIPFSIYDLRAKPTEEELEQLSGMLNLNEGTGLAAIHACGLYEQFLSNTGDCSEADIVADKDGNILHSDEGNGNRPEISRHALTKLLVTQIPEESIFWEYKLLSATAQTDRAQYELDFGPRGKRTADLLVGADGAWSRIRLQLTDKKPHYSGVTFITLSIPSLESRYPHLVELIGHGTFAALGEGNVVMCQRGAGGAARIYLAINTQEEQFDSLSGLNTASPSVVKEKLLNIDTNDKRWKLFDAFGPRIQELITLGLENQSGPVDIKALYMLPVGQLAWKHKAGVTLIGDAAHLMTPFAGEGVNLAMRDALDLVDVIGDAWNGSDCSDPKTFGAEVERRLPEVERAQFKRSEKMAEETWRNLQMFTAPDAASRLAEFLAQHIGPSQAE